MPSQFQSQKASEMMSSASIIRVLVVWLICLASLKLDYLNDYDLRFQIRGDRPAPQDIVIVELNPSDLRHFSTSQVQDLLLLNSSSEISDHYYWNSELWDSLLSGLLSLNPKSIVVTLDLLQQALTEGLDPNILTNSRVKWLFAGDSDELGMPIIPVFEKRKLLEVLNIEYEKDGLVRKINPSKTLSGSRYINFPVTESRFQKISYSQLINQDWPENYFTDKAIVIGAFTNLDSQYITPTGPYSRSALVSQLIENKVNSQWIRSLGFWPQALLLLLLIVFVYGMTLVLPRNLSVSVLVAAIFLSLLLNVYLFDVHYFWFPIFSVSLCLFLGWLTGYTVIANDIEKKNFQLEQESQTRRQLEQLKTNFISLISHDLKNPLAKIQSVVQRNLTSIRPATDPITSDLVSIQKYSEELDHYIRSMLNIARVESKDIKLNIVPSDLNQIVELCLEALTPLAVDKRITIKKDLSPLFLIQVDPILIKEAVINVLENAIKYSDSDSTIHIQTLESDDFVFIQVTDSGMGISEEELQKVGQKFFRSQAVADTTRGTGLGLFLVKYFVELHSGTISFKSSLNKGTTVTIQLPNR